MSTIYLGPVAGTAFRPAGKGLAPGTELTLRLEPDNKYDPKAIAVDAKGVHVGYIPRKDTHILHEVLSDGRRLAAVVVKWNWPHQTLIEVTTESKT